jgi:hypothetical protein
MAMRILGGMRYRLHIPRAELVLAAGASIEGVLRLMNWHATPQHGASSLWAHLSPFVILLAPVLVILRRIGSYVDLAPSSLEYHELLRHRSIPYGQIERIDRGSIALDGKGGGVTQIFASGMKRLDLRLERTADFMAEIRLYAPQAMLTGPDFAVAGEQGY